jgi:hypothetical protein
MPQHHAHSIDRWDDATGMNDFLLAQACCAAAVERWPGAKISPCAMARGSSRRPGRLTIELRHAEPHCPVPRGDDACLRDSIDWGRPEPWPASR